MPVTYASLWQERGRSELRRCRAGRSSHPKKRRGPTFGPRHQEAAHSPGDQALALALAFAVNCGTIIVLIKM
jgi:hypothetical protein